MPESERCDRLLSAGARRALTDGLPLAAAFAAWVFAHGPLRDAPQQVGAPLRAPFEGLWRARRGDDTTVVPADVAYPTDSGLLVKAVRRIAVTGRRIQAAGGATRSSLRDPAEPPASGRTGSPRSCGCAARKTRTKRTPW